MALAESRRSFPADVLLTHDEGWLQISEDAIRARAYLRWVGRGCPEGDGQVDWYGAIADLEAEMSNVVRLVLARMQEHEEAEAIERRAYWHWLSRGCPNGDDQRDWFEAIAEFQAEMNKVIQAHLGRMQGGAPPLTGGKVFIGHGHSQVWEKLRDFLADDLHLNWDEFNRQAPYGLTTTARLQQMLNTACFAFLIMTGEDDRRDGTKQARQNVIYEAGLFQGRLGFQRAIMVIEEDCATFSNIHGLNEIRFPRGDISAAFGKIRQVLEREGILSTRMQEHRLPHAAACAAD